MISAVVYNRDLNQIDAVSSNDTDRWTCAFLKFSFLFTSLEIVGE